MRCQMFRARRPDRKARRPRILAIFEGVSVSPSVTSNTTKMGVQYRHHTGARPLLSGAVEPARESGPDRPWSPTLSLRARVAESQIWWRSPRVGNDGRSIMDVVFPACCGIDVHQKSLVACVRRIEPGGHVRKELRTFATTTAALSELARWLQTLDVTHVALESTGVFWKTVWHMLETRVTALVVNPRDVAQVPGRKTDVSDAEWMAQLLQCGLLRGSFVPPRAIRELRDLSRSRTTLEQQRAAVINRIHKVLEDANIKLGTVVTDIDGVSGRAIVHALIEGQTDATALAALAKGRLRNKLASLREAVTGHVTDHHRFLLRRLMAEVRFLDEEIAAFNTRIEEATRPFDEL